MTRPLPRLRLTAVLAAVLVGTAGCGGAPADPPAVSTPHDAGLAASLPADVREAGVLRLATDAAYPPANAFGPDGRTVVGFEPDLAAAIGRVLGVRVEFVVGDFTESLDDMNAGEVDGVMAAMTDTPERQERADFVDYFSAGTSLLVQRGNPRGIVDLAGLCGEVVAVEEGTTQVDFLAAASRSCVEPIQVEEFPTSTEALLELRTGRAAAVPTDYPPATHLTTDPRTRAHFQLASTVQYEPGFYGIAVPKERPELRDALRGALDRVIASGEYADVLTEWDVQGGAIEPGADNAGGAAA